jgi:hypothetical protein
MEAKEDLPTLWRKLASLVTKAVNENDPEQVQERLETVRGINVRGQLYHIAQSGMGKLVRGLTKSEHEGVAAAAKQMMAAWKQIHAEAKEAAAASSAEASASGCVF